MALLVLRVGLGVFLLLWSIDKMLAPEQTAKIFQFFCKTPLPVSFTDPVLRSPGLRERHIPADGRLIGQGGVEPDPNPEVHP